MSKFKVPIIEAFFLGIPDGEGADPIYIPTVVYYDRDEIQAAPRDTVLRATILFVKTVQGGPFYMISRSDHFVQPEDGLGWSSAWVEMEHPPEEVEVPVDSAGAEET